jgi:phosphoribosylaminoimidazole-succinocarboxamide synthase
MNVLKTIDIPFLGDKEQGKVRDIYKKGQLRILITTDRISAFDKVLGFIPHKGQVLNQLSQFWFEKTKDIVPNHMIAIPDPNVVVAKECQAIPIEIVVRGYISGVTTTSLWYHYNKGERFIYGHKFPDGLVKNQKLPKPILTPTTRAAVKGGHDEPISKEEIIKRKIIPASLWRQIERVALNLFDRGTKICAQAGLILVDTKYEFGLNKGKLTLIDEIHTPDSSRFWIKKTYRQRFKQGLEPENFDKEFFRLWYAKRNYIGDGEPPKLPQSFIKKVSDRYVTLFERLTGSKLKVPKEPIKKRIIENLKKYFKENDEVGIDQSKSYRVGIVGGGQLGKMMAQAAKKMGFYVAVLDPTKKSPAGQVADKQIVADFNDEKAIKKLASGVDFLTFEIENTNGEFLDGLEKKFKCRINPSGKSWRLFQDKLKQKELFSKAKLPTADYMPIKSFSDLPKAAERFHYLFLLKARFNAYDGRGNFLVRDKNDLQNAWRQFRQKTCYAEKFIPFKKELAVMVARTKDEVSCYPVVETIQLNNICHYVLAPAKIPAKIKKQATDLATKTIKLIQGAGVFGIEMFLTQSGKVLLNEIAPRVHNSGHYTIEACVTSQFEQHIRAICGLPLGSTQMLVPAAAMVNILGQKMARLHFRGLNKALAVTNSSIHIYGKDEIRIERKMGHITVVGEDLKEALERAKLARSLLEI